MFKKKKDPVKEKMRNKLLKHAKKVQKEADMKKQRAKLLRNEDYVNAKMEEERKRLSKFKEQQRRTIKKGMEDIDATKHELEAFNCFECGAPVNMQNLTCPRCGQLYCQWCGAKMDMQNPGLCPRCKRPPYYTPAQDVITKVEDLSQEERFWEELPECPKCGGAVQKEWDECPICGAKLAGGGGSPAPASRGSAPQQEAAHMAPSDEPGKRRRRKKDKKRRGI